MPRFSPNALAEILNQDIAGHYRLAYSGGLDSTVLLHAMVELQASLPLSFSALHVHHGLNPEADAWASHCRHECERHNVTYQQFNVDATPVKGQSPEETARELRYEALASVMQAGDVLLTAHHQDEQAETLLLQLMRGCGVPGLAAMPFETDFTCGKLQRPLLGFSRAELESYANERQLCWVEDGSNLDKSYDRNFMRHDILPALVERWPAAIANLQRTASHMSEAGTLLDELAIEDLAHCGLDNASSLEIGRLKQLPKPRVRNALRYWLRARGLNVPSQSQLQQVISDVLYSSPDAVACVHWQGVDVRKYQGRLYALSSMSSHDSHQTVNWDMSKPVQINGVGRLDVRQTRGEGLSASLMGQCYDIRFRQGGERVQPVNRGHHHELKKLFQEAGVPPWERDRTPILYKGDEILAIAGLCICEPYQAGKDQPGLILEWNPDFS